MGTISNNIKQYSPQMVDVHGFIWIFHWEDTEIKQPQVVALMVPLHADPHLALPLVSLPLVAALGQSDCLGSWVL